MRGALKTVFVPSGTPENSPPFQGWVRDRPEFESPVRDERGGIQNFVLMLMLWLELKI